MKVKKKIAPLRIGGETFRFNPGDVIPEKVINFWKQNGSFDGLLKTGGIEEVRYEPVRSIEKRLEDDFDEKKRDNGSDNDNKRKRRKSGDTGALD